METITLEQATGEFFAHYQGATLSRYTSAITRWRKWCNENNINTLTVSQAHIEIYAAYLARLGKKKGTISVHISAICLYCQYLYDRGVIEKNPAQHVRRIRQQNRSQGTYLTYRQAQTFLTEAENRDTQTKALCTILLLNGVRIREALTLTVEDFHNDTEQPWVLLHRKFSWLQRVRLAPAAAQAIQEHIGNRKHGYIFRNKGKQLPYYIALQTIKDIGAAVSEETITPHSLRRTFCTLSRDAGIPDRDIMVSGGWASQSMLSYYDMGARAQKSTAPLRLEQYLQEGTAE